jgi:hypothetical protein
MRITSKKSILAEVVVTPIIAIAAGWLLYYGHITHGFVHHFFETFTCLVFVVAFATFAIYGAHRTGAVSRGDITGPDVESTLVRVVYALPERVHSFGGSKLLNVLKFALSFLFFGGTFVDLIGAYTVGGYDNVVRAISGCLSLFCIGVFLLRHDSDGLGGYNPRTAAERKEIVATALTKLVACFVTIAGCVGWFFRALKQGGFYNWWGFTCFAIGFVVATVSLLKYAGEARFAPERREGGRGINRY